MNTHYTRTQKILHWLLTVLILFWLFVSGEFVADAEGAAKPIILSVHSGGAIIILALTLYRYSLRRKNPVAPLQELKAWEKIWSVRVHLLLYVLVFIMVLSGILQGVFYDQPVRVLGFINITATHNEFLQGLFHEVHEITATLLKLFIALHILAALKHQFIDKTPSLKRMV